MFGSERARVIGEKIRMHLDLKNVDILTSPSVRTVQTANLMFGDAKHLPGRHTICGDDVIEKLVSDKKVGSSMIVVTHSTCFNDLIKVAGYRKGSEPEYGSLLFLKFLPEGSVQVLGKLGVNESNGSYCWCLF